MQNFKTNFKLSKTQGGYFFPILSILFSKIVFLKANIRFHEYWDWVKYLLRQVKLCYHLCFHYYFINCHFQFWGNEEFFYHFLLINAQPYFYFHLKLSEDVRKFILDSKTYQPFLEHHYYLLKFLFSEMLLKDCEIFLFHFH